MEIVIAVIAVAVLGLAALVAAGRFGEMQAEPVRDVYQPPVPEGELSAADLEQMRFGISPLGYDMSQVDELVARMARELDARDNDRLPAMPQGDRMPQSPGDRIPQSPGDRTPESPGDTMPQSPGDTTPQSPGASGGEDISGWAKK